MSLISQEKQPPPPLHPGSQTAEEGEGWGKRRVSLAVPPIWESLCI